MKEVIERYKWAITTNYQVEKKFENKVSSCSNFDCQYVMIQQYI